jgi:hypothetical protein
MESCKCERGSDGGCWREAKAGGLCAICLVGCAELRLGNGVTVLFAAAQLIASHVPSVIRMPKE